MATLHPCVICSLLRFWTCVLVAVVLRSGSVEAATDGLSNLQTNPAGRKSQRANHHSTGAVSNLWSFQPMSNPTVPTSNNLRAGTSPIDCFIGQKLQEQRLRPALVADRRTLIRRATFDLTGLPPTPGDIDAFLKDHSPDAFAKVVDRLLSSRRYGERWGRHWLDVVRYADSNGLDENVAFGNAWRYRDYVIQSFDQNKPYDRFVQEQLAGDLLPDPIDSEAKFESLKALGFLCIGPKLLAEPDKVKLEMDMIDEQIETMGRVFLGTTLGCARCHDHKFDPIATSDYYALAAIFKSTRTMDDLKTIAKWHEVDIARPEERQAQETRQQTIAQHRRELEALIAEANRSVLVSRGTNGLPKDVEKLYSTNTLASLDRLRGRIKTLEEEAPEPSTSMGVTEATNILHSLAVHIRGSHLTLGTPVERGVPSAMIVPHSPVFGDRQSGRLEVARWMTDPEHPLTARIMVNRIWRWHFGQGLVKSTDNFGRLGERPSHPELLDWLARRFIADGWDVKSMHRLLMLSGAYQRSTQMGQEAQTIDPENRFLSCFSMRRLEAEEIRDSLLFVSGQLDLAEGGKTIPLKNREFVFNHTSQDNTRYDSPRRAVYLPIIRNHLYDLFEQFDFPDPAVPNGNRGATVVAPQALWMMNGDLVAKAARTLAERILGVHEATDAQCLREVYLRTLGRHPSMQERRRAQEFFLTYPSGPSPGENHRIEAWSAFCQALMASNEFMYLN